MMVSPYIPLCIPVLEEKYPRTLVIPDYLKPLIAASKKVSRYTVPNYPVLILDTDESHQIRVASKALLLEYLPHKSRLQISHTALIHDMCEVVLGNRDLRHDLTSPEKESDPILAKQVDAQELLNAQNNLIPADFALWQEFELAKLFLRAPQIPDLNPPSIESYITKILDITDGDMFFHLSASNIIQKEQQRIDNHFPLGSFNFGPKQYRRYAQRITQLALSQVEKRILQGLLQEMLIYFVQQWSRIDIGLLPTEIREELQWARSEIAGVDISWLYEKRSSSDSV